MFSLVINMNKNNGNGKEISKLDSKILRLQYFDSSIEPDDANILLDVLLGKDIMVEDMFTILVKCDRNPTFRQFFEYVIRARGKIGQLKVLKSIEKSINRLDLIIENGEDETVIKAVKLFLELYERLRAIAENSSYNIDNKSSNDIIGYIISKTKKIKGEKEDDELAETIVYTSER